MVTSRIWFTAAQKAELWERWKNGQSAAAISRACLNWPLLALTQGLIPAAETAKIPLGQHVCWACWCYPLVEHGSGLTPPHLGLERSGFASS